VIQSFLDELHVCDSENATNGSFSVPSRQDRNVFTNIHLIKKTCNTVIYK